MNIIHLKQWLHHQEMPAFIYLTTFFFIFEWDNDGDIINPNNVKSEAAWSKRSIVIRIKKCRTWKKEDQIASIRRIISAGYTSETDASPHCQRRLHEWDWCIAELSAQATRVRLMHRRIVSAGCTSAPDASQHCQRMLQECAWCIA